MRNLVLISLLFLATALLPSTDARAHGNEIGALKIHHPWTRATPNGADVAGGFMAIENTGTTDDRLVSVRVELADMAEVHEMAMDNGMMKMHPLADGIVIPAGKTVTLKPGSFHIMMMGLKSPFLEGDYIKATLVFEKAGELEIEFVVEAQGANLKPADLVHPSHK